MPPPAAAGSAGRAAASSRGHVVAHPAVAGAADGGVDIYLSVLFLVALPALAFLGYKSPQRVSGAVSALATALVAYQLFFADGQLFGTEGIAPAVEGIAHFVKVSNVGAWPLVLAVALVAGLFGQYIKFLGALVTGFETGWLLATPVYQLASANVTWLDSDDSRALLRQLVFLGLAGAFAAASLCSPRALAIVLSPFIGAYLAIAGGNRLAFTSRMIGEDCFWPDAYFAGYAQRQCGLELAEWSLLAAVAVATQVLLARRRLAKLEKLRDDTLAMMATTSGEGPTDVDGYQELPGEPAPGSATATADPAPEPAAAPGAPPLHTESIGGRMRKVLSDHKPTLPNMPHMPPVPPMPKVELSRRAASAQQSTKKAAEGMQNSFGRAWRALKYYASNLRPVPKGTPHDQPQQPQAAGQTAHSAGP